MGDSVRTELDIPFPPSVNTLFANRKGGRFKTEKYKTWIDEAGWMIKTQRDRHNRHAGNVSFTLFVRRPDNRRRDIDNLQKAVLDLIVRHRILADDSQIESSTVKWVYEAVQGARVVIEDMP